MADTSNTTASQKADPKDNAAPSVVATSATTGGPDPRVSAAPAKLTDEQQKAVDDAADARKKADEAAAKAADAKLSPEDKAAKQASQDADDAAAAAAEATKNTDATKPVTTVADAGVIAPVSGDTSLDDHRAFKRGNDPANPLPLSEDTSDPDQKTVRLVLISPDTTGPRETYVHPDMVGDYLRAGWAKG